MSAHVLLCLFFYAKVKGFNKRAATWMQHFDILHILNGTVAPNVDCGIDENYPGE
jgi:hypothetical protein